MSTDSHFSGQRQQYPDFSHFSRPEMSAPDMSAAPEFSDPELSAIDFSKGPDHAGIKQDLRFQRITKSPLYPGGADTNSGTSSGSDENNMSSWVMSGLSTSYGASVMIALFTFILLVSVQPPFVRKESTPVEEGRLDWWLVGLWTLIAAVLVLFIPPVRRFCGQAFKS